MGSVGFVSGVVDDCYDSPHPTSTTAAIVVSRRCFITGVSDLLITNDLNFQCFLGHTFGHTFSASTPKPYKTLGKWGD
jgi:hypothetical protein